jgi:hypothetical protein
MRSDKRVFMVGMAGVLVGALLVAMLPAVAAVVGDPLGLGEVNSIDERTDLKGKAKGANLQIKNTGNARAVTAKADKIAVLAKATSGPVALSAKASRNAIKVKVDAGQAPIKVNASAGTATNLSADLLDGLDSSAFLRAPGVRATHAGGLQSENVTGTDEVVRSVTLPVPADGVVIVNSTAEGVRDVGGDGVVCSITTGTTLEAGFSWLWLSSGVLGSVGQLAGTRGFDVTRTRDMTFNLVCSHFGSTPGSATIVNSALTAIFIPTP